MINIETLAYHLEQKSNCYKKISVELYPDIAGFDISLLMGLSRQFRNPEIVGVFLGKEKYSVEYYSSILSANETFLSPDLSRIRNKSCLLKSFESVRKRFNNGIENTFTLSIGIQDVSFPDAELFMNQMLKIFKIKYYHPVFDPDIEFVCSD